jgi:hypothetical protein
LQKVLGEEHRRSEKRSVRALALLHDEEGAEVLDDFFVLDARVAGKNHIRVWEYVRGLVLREREREREREFDSVETELISAFARRALVGVPKAFLVLGGVPRGSPWGLRLAARARVGLHGVVRADDLLHELVRVGFAYDPLDRCDLVSAGHGEQVGTRAHTFVLVQVERDRLRAIRVAALAEKLGRSFRVSDHLAKTLVDFPKENEDAR